MTSFKRFIFSKKTLIYTGAVIVAIVGSSTAVWLKSHQTTYDERVQAEDAPKYKTILPGDKTIKQLGGWTRVSPPENDPVYAYSDKIGDVSISVSEQPLPDTFKNNIDSHVSETAKTFNATTQIQADETKVYTGTSAQGPQSVIFTKNNLLVLIKSQQKVDDEDWIKYIKSLS